MGRRGGSAWRPVALASVTPVPVIPPRANQRQFLPRTLGARVACCDFALTRKHTPLEPSGFSPQQRALRRRYPMESERLGLPRPPNDNPVKRRVEMAFLCGVQTEAEAPNPSHTATCPLGQNGKASGPGSKMSEEKKKKKKKKHGKQKSLPCLAKGCMACAPPSTSEVLSRMGLHTITNAPSPCAGI